MPNTTSLRPVDRVAGSLISWMGGGVQPANRSKQGMFDDDAPIWTFKNALGATEDPELARQSEAGLFIVEVFPALALAGINAAYCNRLAGPRYNPARRKTFNLSHWANVVETVDAFGSAANVAGLRDWCRSQIRLDRPRKADQDKLDAVICALAGLHWMTAPREESVMIGDIETGYMIAPALAGAHERIIAKAAQVGVSIDGAVPPSVGTLSARADL